jgi:hypothetical protein
MSPDVDPLIPPHSADELLGQVLARGRAIQWQQRRRRITVTLAPALLVMVLGVGLAVSRSGQERTPARVATAAPSGDGTTTTTLPDVPGLDQLGGQLPGPDLGAGGPSVTNPAATTSTTAISSTTTAPRVAPTAVFDLQLPDGRYSTAVLRSGSTHPTTITAATVDRQWPVLSPDGKRIAFSSTQRNLLAGVRSIWEIYVINVDGTGLRQITASPLDAGHGSRWPSWSPDGKEIVASCANNSSTPAICVLLPDGLGLRVIGDATYQLFMPRWSPDGGSVVALHDEGGSMVTAWLLDPTGAAKPHRAAGKAFHFDGETAPAWVVPGRLVLDGQPSSLDPVTGVLTPIAVAQGSQMTACGPGQVLYRTSEAFGPAKAGDLVVVGLDGSMPTVVLSRSVSANLIPSSCARG